MSISEHLHETGAGSARTPLITIGITCFNAADTIRRAIDSAMRQTWAHVEVIVIDDCSKDGSADVAAKALEDWGGGRLIRLTRNVGVAQARNLLLEAAQGDLIAFFDDDDESLPHRLAAQHRAIIDYEARVGTGLILCIASGRRRYPNGYMSDLQAIGSRPEIPKGLDLVDYALVNDRRPEVFYGRGTPSCALMARISTLRHVGGYDGGLRRVEDVDLAIRLGLAGAHFIGTEEKLFLQHATIGTDKTPMRNLESELILIDKYKDYLERRGLYRYARDWFRFRAAYFSKRYPSAFGLLLSIFLRNPVRTARHFLRSAPARFRHEQRMNAPASTYAS